MRHKSGFCSGSEVQLTVDRLTSVGQPGWAVISLCHLEGGIQTGPVSQLSAAEQCVCSHLPGPFCQSSHSRRSFFSGLDHSICCVLSPGWQLWKSITWWVWCEWEMSVDSCITTEGNHGLLPCAWVPFTCSPSKRLFLSFVLLCVKTKQTKNSN